MKNLKFVHNMTTHLQSFIPRRIVSKLKELKRPSKYLLHISTRNLWSDRFSDNEFQNHPAIVTNVRANHYQAQIIRSRVVTWHNVNRNNKQGRIFDIEDCTMISRQIDKKANAYSLKLTGEDGFTATKSCAGGSVVGTRISVRNVPIPSDTAKPQRISSN